MIALIVACARNRVIGKGGKIPWNIPGEQARFRELTMGQVVVMGRRTYEEIGKPLANRITIVVSQLGEFVGENCYTAKSLKEAIEFAENHFPKKDIFISGGSRLYEESLPLVDKMFITEIEAEFEGDTFFPKFSHEQFEREVERQVEGQIPYIYVTYISKRGNHIF